MGVLYVNVFDSQDSRYIHGDLQFLGLENVCHEICRRCGSRRTGHPRRRRAMASRGTAGASRRTRRPRRRTATSCSAASPSSAGTGRSRRWVERFDRRGTEPNELFRSEFGQNSFKIQEFSIFARNFKKIRKFQHFRKDNSKIGEISIKFHQNPSKNHRK